MKHEQNRKLATRLAKSMSLAARIEQDKKIDRERILKPSDWPMWPVLPLKVRDDKKRSDPNNPTAFGLLLHDRPEGYERRIYFRSAGEISFAEALKHGHLREFESVDALLEEYQID